MHNAPIAPSARRPPPTPRGVSFSSPLQEDAQQRRPLTSHPHVVQRVTPSSASFIVLGAAVGGAEGGADAALQPAQPTATSTPRDYLASHGRIQPLTMSKQKKMRQHSMLPEMVKP